MVAASYLLAKPVTQRRDTLRMKMERAMQPHLEHFAGIIATPRSRCNADGRSSALRQ